MSDVAIKRFPSMVKAAGILGGEQAAQEITTKLRNEFGDSFTRAEVQHLLTIRGKICDGGEVAAPASLKVVDFLIKSMQHSTERAAQTSRPLPRLSSRLLSEVPPKDSPEVSRESSPKLSPAQCRDRARELLDALRPVEPIKIDSSVDPCDADYWSEPEEKSCLESRSPVACTPDGSAVLSNLLTIRKCTTAEVTHQTDCPECVRSARFLDRDQVLAVDIRDRLKLWNVSQDRLEDLLPNLGVVRFELSADHRRAAILTRDGHLRIYDFRTRSLVPDIDLPNLGDESRLAVSNGVIICARGEKAYCHNLKDGSTVELLGTDSAGMSDFFDRLALSPDGRILALTSGNVIYLWTLPHKNGAEPRVLACDASKKAVRALVFSPDSGVLFSADWNGTIIRWDVASGEPIGEPIVFRNEIIRLDVSDDGRTLSVLGEDQQRSYAFPPL